MTGGKKSNRSRVSNATVAINIALLATELSRVRVDHFISEGRRVWQLFFAGILYSRSSSSRIVVRLTQYLFLFGFSILERFSSIFLVLKFVR